MLVRALFLIAIVPAVGIGALSAVQLVSKQFQFWPPPTTTSWQYWTFRWLFRVMLFGLIGLSVVDFGALGAPTWRYYVSLPLACFGFAAAFHLTNYLGWRTAFGADEGLKTDGAYRWSRNPIYVVTIIAAR